MLWGKEVCDGVLKAPRCSSCSLQSHGVPRLVADLLSHIPVPFARAVERADLNGRIWTVEGAGVAAWAGLRPAQDRIRWLIMEIIGPEAQANLPGRTGWNAYYIRDYELVPSRTGEFEHRAPFYNWLFCPADRETLVATLKPTRFAVSPPGSSAFG